MASGKVGASWYRLIIAVLAIPAISATILVISIMARVLVMAVMARVELFRRVNIGLRLPFPPWPQALLPFPNGLVLSDVVLIQVE